PVLRQARDQRQPRRVTQRRKERCALGVGRGGATSAGGNRGHRGRLLRDVLDEQVGYRSPPFVVGLECIGAPRERERVETRFDNRQLGAAVDRFEPELDQRFWLA